MKHIVEKLKNAASSSAPQRAIALLFMCIVLAAPGLAQNRSDLGRLERFTINVPDKVLKDLKERLARTRWPDQLPGTGWDYGADTSYLRVLAHYWQTKFDWRAQEARLNQFDHFRAQVGGMRIHFVYARSRRPNAVPLLLLHGWPSSFVQMLDIIPLLVDPAGHGMAAAPSFDVVVASLPGFGFSDIPKRPGVGFATSADLMDELMHDVLGYTKYAIRGSDLGGRIARQIAFRHPEHVIGVHLTGMIGTAGAAPPFTPAEQAFIDADAASQQERAYARLQSSKPQTLAHSLNDSPVGLAAWIVEKFRAWSDSKGNVESRFTKDELLTNLMVYWATGTAPSSVRMYYDFSRELLTEGRIERPVGMLMTTEDVFPAAPREWGERFFNVRRWAVTNVGGHFLEWEEPSLVARELQAFFGSVDTTADEAAVREVLDEITRTFNTGDYEAMLAQYRDDVIVSGSAGPDVVGKDAWRSALKSSMPPDVKLKMRFNTSELKIEGDLAYERGTFIVQTMDKAGVLQPLFSGRHIHIFQRAESGWKGWRLFEILDLPAASK
jgi:pimeloyl-ACP methyl ester carboxylesterase